MYRFFEILPGTLAWLTLILMVLCSWRLPVFVSVFIIFFDIYWFLKIIYLSLHLRSTFSAMKANLKINWLRRLDDQSRVGAPTAEGASELVDWRDIYHLIIFPIYREPYQVAKESFESLAGANYPKDRFIVVLATEERGGDAAWQTAKRIEQEFGSRFFKFLVTVHPANLPGEIPGKGSNETWAAKEAKRLIIDPLINTRTNADITRTVAETIQHLSASSQRQSAFSYENILVSVFDIDTQIFSEYFGRLTYVFLHSPDRLRAIYQPIPLFTNNIYQAPALARVIAFSSTFWQMMQQSRPERLTSFSSQSLPFKALLDIGFWHTDVVSEDSRIFWQCYLHYHGNFRVEPLLYPVSMDSNVGPTFWQTLKQVYKQQRRWAWGVENTPYLFDGFRKDSLIPRAKKWYWGFTDLEGRHSWATNSIMIFILGWLPTILGGRHFNKTLLSYSLPSVTRFIIELSMVGVASSAILTMLILPPRPRWFRWRHYFLFFIQWLLLPITLNVFGALPALEAQTRLMLGGRWRLGFWPTPKSRTAMNNE